MAIAGVLPYIQIILSVLLIVCVLLQQTGASMGGAFGGDNFSAGYHTRRGAERTLFYSTIVLGILLGSLCLLGARATLKKKVLSI
jgi:protein translocase SecG subunit